MIISSQLGAGSFEKNCQPSAEIVLFRVLAPFDMDVLVDLVRACPGAMFRLGEQVAPVRGGEFTNVLEVVKILNK